MDEIALNDALDVHDTNVRKHGVEEAEAILRAKRPDSADEIIAIYREHLGKPLRVRGLLRYDHDGWYLPKPDVDSPRWRFAKSQLGLPDEVIARTAEVADEILARLDDPMGESICSRGLVLGHVQSGKTTSFLSVAAKAADVGYDLIIVLAGVHNSLRRQTQERAQRTLVHKPDLWWLGTATGDFTKQGNALGSQLFGDGKRGLLVVKKNKIILEKLADWLEEASDTNSLREKSILVIDDEADQAGLNVSRSGDLEGVHQQLQRIVNLQTSAGKRRCAYLAYTATPYANILTAQDRYGLYPRDFIYPLDKPESYVGAEEIFGPSSVGDPIRLDEDNPDGDELTPGLEDAIKWFVLATAARATLGDPLGTFHSSMLVHTSQRVDVQEALKDKIEGYLLDLANAVDADPDVMREFYEDVLADVPSRPGGGPGALDEGVADWDSVAPLVPDVLRNLLECTPSTSPYSEDGKTLQAKSGVIVDNSKVDSIDRLTYSDLAAGDPGVIVIAVGGNTLSRGLTLEGLICSYFSRQSQNYDTLMQMGRWFGYRPGYRHLVRVWTTKDLLASFIDLNTVEQELRDELMWMQDQNLRPDEYGPRIRRLPNLQITRANAMHAATAIVSYSDYQFDPAWLNLDADAITANQATVREFAFGLDGHRSGGSSLLFEGVPLADVRGLLERFEFHPNETRLDMASLEKYLDAESSALAEWNVLFKSLNSSKRPFDFGGPVGPVNPITRSLMNGETTGQIGSTVDSSDHRADIANHREPLNAHYRDRGEPPLLIIYAVDPTSTPDSRSKGRAPLNAASHPITLAFYLPVSNTNVDYVAPMVRKYRYDDEDPDLGDYGEHDVE